jgi:hypothetical protein
VGLERGTLSLVSTIDELLERKLAASAEVGTNFANKRRSFARGLRSRSLLLFACLTDYIVAHPRKQQPKLKLNRYDITVCYSGQPGDGIAHFVE